MALDAIPSGYVIINGQHPPMELINAVKAEVNDRLADFQGAASNEHGYGMLGWGPRCATLFRNQTEIFDHPFIVNQIGDNPESNLYMRGLVCFIKNDRPLPRLRIGYDRIYIYQALDKELGPGNGLFTLVPGSHLKEANSVERQAEVQIRLLPGQTLLVDGNMVIRYPQGGGGLCMMAAYWRRKDNL